MKIKSIILSLATLALVGCGGSGSTTTAVDACDKLSDDTFSCDTMLNNLVSEGVLPVVQDLEAKLESLDSKVIAYCGEITDDIKLSEAKAAWTSVVAPLQQLQVMNFGPNANSDSGLLPLYDWQTAHPINIDTAIAQNALATGDKLSVIDNEKDLVAVEYVLFDYAAIQTSNPENPNTTTWRSGKSDSAIQQDRCDYAELVTAALKSHVNVLASTWEEYDLAASFSSKQNAANQVAESLFYIDKITKDAKIKAVLPQADDPNADFDAAKLESQFAKENKEAILNNLIGAKRIFTLNDGDDSKTAIDDYLKAAGQQAVSDRMITALDVAIANTNAITNDIYTAVDSATNANEAACKNYSSGSLDYVDAGSDLEIFCALQHTVKTLTNELKGDFTFLTSFTIPASASGDND